MSHSLSQPENSTEQRENPPVSAAGSAPVQLSENLYWFEDICNVYLIKTGRDALLIDFGDGLILDHLPALGVRRITDVLMTHHHRDQGQGLRRAVEAGARIWAPYNEQDLFQQVDAHWQAREVYNNYNVRQDRFSLLEPVPLAGTLKDYARLRFGGRMFVVVPTPGHTPGSISLMLKLDGSLLAFTGDLISEGGKLWSPAATQWTYNGAEGVAASIPSLVDLKRRAPDLLLPSHGAPVQDPQASIDLLVERLWRLLQLRGHNLRVFKWIADPYEAILPHLLRNRTSMANSYVLLSASRKALFIDFGYDFMTGQAAGADRAAHRPWLYSLNALKRQYGVRQIEAVIPTHYHDDHVAGFNLLREVEGTQVWAAENFADILLCPERYDLPCLWYDPILSDRVLPLGVPVQWEEYTLTLYPLPGHTRYAVAIVFAVDGQTVMAIGDQYQSDGSDYPNYVYQNGFDSHDYTATAELFERIRPDLVLPGHSLPVRTDDGYFERVRLRGEQLEQLHQEMLPEGTAGLDADSLKCAIHPYQAQAAGGETILFEVEVRDRLQLEVDGELRLSAPPGWRVMPEVVNLKLGTAEAHVARFFVSPPEGLHARRVRIAADLTAAGQRLGQLAEALVTVL